MQYAQLKPLTNYATRNMLHVLGISSDYSFFNGDVTFRGLEGDSQMLIMGLIKDYLHQYGYSEAGLEDFLLHDAHSFYYHPIKETLFGEPLWDHQDRLHGDLVIKEAGETKGGVNVEQLLTEDALLAAAWAMRFDTVYYVKLRGIVPQTLGLRLYEKNVKAHIKKLGGNTMSHFSFSNNSNVDAD